MRRLLETTIVGACVAASMFAFEAPASAQIGGARQLTGAPVAAQAVRARFVWAGTGNRIIWVNQADEVYYHRVHGNRVDMQIRMRGHTVGHAGDPTEYVIPWGRSSILVVTQRGNLYRHQIRAESIGPPEQIPGAPVGTHNQDPVFMFKMGNRLINATRSGEIWAHQIGRVVSPPQRIGAVTLAPSRTVRHAFNIGRRVFIVLDDGSVVSHDIHPSWGRARVVRSATVELGRPATRFVWVMGNRLYAVNEAGTLWAHDISGLLPRRGAPATP